MRLTVALALILPALLSAQAVPPQSKAAMADFLRSGKITRTKDIANGVTNSRRLTLTDGTLTHDAHLQTIDQAMTSFQGNRGTELNFRDTWKYNVAAYRLAEMLDLDHMVPISIERNVGGSTGALTWWCDNVKFDEGKRVKDKINPPDLPDWNNQMFILRVFDQLIYNTDRNLGNMLITNDWRVVMIDHTRAFRLMKQLQNPKNLAKCERGLLAKMKALDENQLFERTKGYLTREEVRSVIGRRDLIVQFFEKGGDALLYDYPRPQTPKVYWGAQTD
ncbi:MAG: hypothetical protein NTV70_25645 [Acidobacteria bacterium]|nr:hypothetical protein [Acidobacteriota bacterium]